MPYRTKRQHWVDVYAVDKSGNRGARQSVSAVTPGAGVALDCGYYGGGSDNQLNGGPVANRNRNGGFPEIGFRITDLSSSNTNTNDRIYCVDAGRSGGNAGNDLAQLIVAALAEAHKSDGNGPFRAANNNAATNINVAQARFERNSNNRATMRIALLSTNTTAIFGSSNSGIYFPTSGQSLADSIRLQEPRGGDDNASFGGTEIGIFTVVVQLGS